jgi:hypothetical protein
MGAIITVHVRWQMGSAAPINLFGKTGDELILVDAN